MSIKVEHLSCGGAAGYTSNLITLTDPLSLLNTVQVAESSGGSNIDVYWVDEKRVRISVRYPELALQTRRRSPLTIHRTQASGVTLTFVEEAYKRNN